MLSPTRPEPETDLVGPIKSMIRNLTVFEPAKVARLGVILYPVPWSKRRLTTTIVVMMIGVARKWIVQVS